MGDGEGGAGVLVAGGGFFVGWGTEGMGEWGNDHEFSRIFTNGEGAGMGGMRGRWRGGRSTAKGDFGGRGWGRCRRVH